MKILGVRFAPLCVPLERRLQTLAVATLVLLFIFGDIMGYVCSAYIIFYTQTSWYIIMLYFVWMYYDWDTCNRGGRSKAWSKWIQENALYRYYCNYFPIKVVKMVELDPMKSYLFINVPHGILSLGACGTFLIDGLGHKKIFPGHDLRIIAFEHHFWIPLFREIVYFLGACSANARSIEYLLSTPPKRPYTGRITILLIGGALEAMESLPGTYRTAVKKRKGFVKLALKHGSPLVPLISFGETDFYDQVYGPEGSTFRRIQNCIRKIVRIPLFLASGRGFFQYSFGLLPKRLPVTLVVGSPMNVPKIAEPSAEQIDEYHEKFIKHLVELFESQKHKYIKNAETTTLELLDF